MAKQYRALSNIEHGEDVEEGNRITRFPFGSIVEGLDKDTMKNLWDAGVLEEVDSVPPTPTSSVTVRSNPTPTPTSAGGDGGTDGGEGKSPAAPDGQSKTPNASNGS